jgi:hypothetical protein
MALPKTAKSVRRVPNRKRRCHRTRNDLRSPKGRRRCSRREDFSGHQPELREDTNWPRQAEGVIRSLACSEGIRFHYEPRHFRTGLKGRGMNGIRPDFYLPGFHLYIEVTVGAESVREVKETKIAGAIQYAKGRDRDLVILLFDATMMLRLRDREITLRDAVAEALEQQFGILPEDLLAAA